MRDRNTDRAPGHPPPLPPTGRGITGGGFMSPLRRLMETAERVLEADYQPFPPAEIGVPLSLNSDDPECFEDAPPASTIPARFPRTTGNAMMTGAGQIQTITERQGRPRPTRYRDGTPRWVDERRESDFSSRPSTTTSHTIPEVVRPQPRVMTPPREIGTSPVGRSVEASIPTPTRATIEPTVARTSPQHVVTPPVSNTVNPTSMTASP